MGDHQPAHRQRRARRRRRAARGDPRLALARGLPGARRRALGRPLRRRRWPTARRTLDLPPAPPPTDGGRPHDRCTTPYDALPDAAARPSSPTPGSTPRPSYAAIVARARGGPARAAATTCTSAATIPADARGAADFAAREPGVVAGLGVAALVFHYVMGDDVDDRRPGPRRHPRRAGRRRDARRRAGPRPAHRRAHRAQLRLPPLRRRHRHRRAGSTPSRAPAPGCSTPARRCPGCRALQKYAVRCGGGVNHRFSLSDRAMVKDNHVVAAGGVVPALRGGARGVPRPAGRGRGHRPRPAARAARRRLRARSCSTTCRPRRWPRRSGSPPAAPPSRPPAGSPSSAPARSRETGVDFISVGALTHSVQVFDLGMDLREG